MVKTIKQAAINYYADTEFARNVTKYVKGMAKFLGVRPDEISMDSKPVKGYKTFDLDLATENYIRGIMRAYHIPPEAIAVIYNIEDIKRKAKQRMEILFKKTQEVH